MKLTVAICTWNRGVQLEQTLDKLCDLRIPRGVEWELLVINNNCTDKTENVVDRFADRLPIQHLFERQQGKSHAANLAIDTAQGDLLLWTDDDVLVDPEWLAAYVIAAKRYPTASFFGGPISPCFQQAPPLWMMRNMEQLADCFALLDPTPADGKILGKLPFGANMATRRCLFEQFHFDTSIGLCADDDVRAEETWLLKCARDGGHHGYWVPDASVRHLIPKERLTARYVWKWYVGHGRAMVRCGQPERVPLLFGAPRWAFRKYMQQRFRAGVLSMRKSHRWLEAYTTAAICAGIIRESRAAKA